MSETQTEENQNRTLTPSEAPANHRAERALKLLWDDAENAAIRIDSTPNPMFVTVEDDGLSFWAHDYTWKCQRQTKIGDSVSKYETVVDELHWYASRDYGISMTRKSKIDTEKKPRGTSLSDF